jgi:hypothetical protein
VLDVAEEAVREPQALRDLIATTARAAAHAAGQATAAPPTPGGPAGGGRGRPANPGVEHITIS